MSSLSQIQQLLPSQLVGGEVTKLRAILKQAMVDLRVAIPAIIQSFDPVEQTATVQVALKEIVRQTQGPEEVIISPINHVPVIQLRAGGFSCLLPINPGDECLLIFADMCFDLWWTRGGVQSQLERRRHDITDCFAILGPWSQPRKFSDYPTDHAELRSDDGTTKVEIHPTEIKLLAPTVTINSSGTVNITGQHVVIDSTSNDTSIDGKTFLPHTHSGVQPGGGTSGPVT